jgi:hypothetical protein
MSQGFKANPGLELSNTYGVSLVENGIVTVWTIRFVAVRYQPCTHVIHFFLLIVLPSVSLF